MILGILSGKEKKTVKDFLKKIPTRIRKGVEAVCVDLYTGFINAAKEVFPSQTKITADRFHVAKLYRNAVEDLRKKEMARLKKELADEEYKKLKGAMWIIRKKESDLSDEEKEVRNHLFKYSPDLKKAYELSNEITDLFNSDISKFHAKHKINTWIRKVQGSGLKCFDKFINTLRRLKDEICNYFIDRNSSGFVEGLNNKIKSIKRRCYGITNTDHLFQRIYLDITGYSRFK